MICFFLRKFQQVVSIKRFICFINLLSFGAEIDGNAVFWFFFFKPLGAMKMFPLWFLIWYFVSSLVVWTFFFYQCQKVYQFHWSLQGFRFWFHWFLSPFLSYFVYNFTDFCFACFKFIDSSLLRFFILKLNFIWDIFFFSKYHYLMLYILNTVLTAAHRTTCSVSSLLWNTS